MSWLMREHADDFFEVYQALKTHKNMNVLGLAVVNLAFSLELYLKELYAVVDKDNIPKLHNILELFRKLPKSIQLEIRDHPSIQNLVAFYSERIPLYIPQCKNKKDITNVLEQQIHKISDAFEQRRYAYEYGALDFDEGTALVLVEAIKLATDNARKPLKT